MAFSSSFLASATFRDVLNGADAYKMGPASSPSTTNIALFNNSVAPSIDTDPNEYGVSPWNANEVSGTGWAAGGIAVTSPSLTKYSAVGVQFSCSNISQATTTLTNAYGCILYDAGSPFWVMAAVAFGGGYSTTAGTFAITWATVNSLATVWYINLT